MPIESKLQQPYDTIASTYNECFSRVSTDRYLKAIYDLLLKNLEPSSSILDLCCGTGDFALALQQFGFQVRGLDISHKMVEFARRKSPEIEFSCSDARNFTLTEPVDAITSIFDSLNHMLSIEEIRSVFNHVFDALTPGGSFLFDMSSGQGFQDRWRGIIKAESREQYFLAECRYDCEVKQGVSAVTVFNKDSQNWTQEKQLFISKDYTPQEICTALSEAGFINIAIFDSEHDLGIENDRDRKFYRCKKPS